MSGNSQNNDVEALRAWFRTCPAVSEDNRFRVDYLSENPTEYAIYAVPSTLRYRRNILGKEILADMQEINYIFASKEPYGDIRQNIDNLGFFQSVAAWIIEQNNARTFPQLACGRVTSIVPTLTAYPASVGANSAKYQIQLKVSYRIF